MSNPPDEDPELSALRQHVAELSISLDASERAEQRLRELEQQISSLTELTSEVIAISERGIVLEVNDRFTALFGYGVEEIIGKAALMGHPPEVHAHVLENIRSGSEQPYEAQCQRKDGSMFLAELRGRQVLYQGRAARETVIRDLTDRKREEEALRAAVVEREVCRAQEALLSALSTPLLPISDEILVLPLIGAVTAERATEVQRTLVEGVAARQAKIAILDITGVPDVDALVADALIQATRAARLLGAQVILTGIRPEVAARLVHLGINLTGVVTYGTLQRGVAHALGQGDGASQGVAAGSEQQRNPTS